MGHRPVSARADRAGPQPSPRRAEEGWQLLTELAAQAPGFRRGVSRMVRWPQRVRCCVRWRMSVERKHEDGAWSADA